MSLLTPDGAKISVEPLLIEHYHISMVVAAYPTCMSEADWPRRTLSRTPPFADSAARKACS